MRDTELCYLGLFGFYSALNLVDKSLINIHALAQLCFLAIIGGLAIVYFLHYNFKIIQIIFSVLVISAFSIAAIKTNKTALLLPGMFFITSSLADFRNIVKCAILFCLPALMFVVLCSLVGIIPNYTFDHGGDIAYSLGYGYYSTVPYVAMFLMVCYLYLRQSDITWKEIAGLLLCNELIYLVSTTRLTYFIFLGILVLFILFVKYDLIKQMNKPLIKTLIVLIYPVAFGITIWCAKHYSVSNRTWRKIDNIVNTRLAMANKGFTMYSPKLLGQNIPMVGHGHDVTGLYFYIDSGYVYSFLANGIIFTLIMLAVYTLLAYFACSCNDKMLVVWLIGIAVFTVINNVWTSVTYNPILLCFMPMLLNFKKLSREQKNPFIINMCKALKIDIGR